MKEKVRFVYSNNSESLRTMTDMFDPDKLESAFGGQNTWGIDIVEYSERMRRRDQVRKALRNANENAYSTWPCHDSSGEVYMNSTLTSEDDIRRRRDWSPIFFIHKGVNISVQIT